MGLRWARAPPRGGGGSAAVGAAGPSHARGACGPWRQGSRKQRLRFAAPVLPPVPPLTGAGVTSASGCVLQRRRVSVPPGRGRAALPVPAQHHLEGLHQHAERGQVCHQGLPRLGVLRLSQRGESQGVRECVSGGGAHGAGCRPGVWVREQLWRGRRGWRTGWVSPPGKPLGQKFQGDVGLPASRKEPGPCRQHGHCWDTRVPVMEVPAASARACRAPGGCPRPGPGGAGPHVRAPRSVWGHERRALCRCRALSTGWPGPRGCLRRSLEAELARHVAITPHCVPLGPARHDSHRRAHRPQDRVGLRRQAQVLRVQGTRGWGPARPPRPAG